MAFDILGIVGNLSYSLWPFFLHSIRKDIGPNFVAGFCFGIAFLAAVARQVIIRTREQDNSGSVADLVRRGQLKSGQRGINRKVMISGIEKMGGAIERSWHSQPFKDRAIVPEARNQGPHPTCTFYSFTAGGQMEMNKELAECGERSDVWFDAESMVKDYSILNNRRPKGSDFLNQHQTAGWIFKYLGVDAVSSSWEGTQRLAIDDYAFHSDLTFNEVVAFVNQGKPVLATFLTGEDFQTFKADEIYRWMPKLADDGKLLEMPVPHRVVLIGDGLTEKNQEYVPFLNSHGPGFADHGVGWVFFSVLFNFYVLSIKAHPTVIKTPTYVDLPPSPPRISMDSARQLPTEGPPPRRTNGHPPRLNIDSARWCSVEDPPSSRANVNPRRYDIDNKSWRRVEGLPPHSAATRCCYSDGGRWRDAEGAGGQSMVGSLVTVKKRLPDVHANVMHQGSQQWELPDVHANVLHQGSQQWVLTEQSPTLASVDTFNFLNPSHPVEHQYNSRVLQDQSLSFASGVSSLDLDMDQYFKRRHDKAGFSERYATSMNTGSYDQCHHIPPQLHSGRSMVLSASPTTGSDDGSVTSTPVHLAVPLGYQDLSHGVC